MFSVISTEYVNNKNKYQKSYIIFKKDHSYLTSLATSMSAIIEGCSHRSLFLQN